MSGVPLNGTPGPDETPAEDETIAVAASDETIAVAASDETIVVPQRRDEVPSDATIVVPTNRSVAIEPGAAGGSVGASAPAGASGAAVAEPRPKRGLRAVLGLGPGFDPDRPIALAPGTLPWEQPTGERGVSQGLPVSYQTRQQTATPLETGEDEVHRQVGAAPEWSEVPVRPGREVLPSLERRERRRRLITLPLYGVAVVVCVLGLWAVASIAFG